VRSNGTPVLDGRDSEQVFGELLTRRPAYVPELSPSEGGAAQALFRIFARYMEVVTARLNQAPDKNLLAFLDRLGISLIPPQAARAPVVFTPLPDTGDGRIEARTRLGAQVAGRPDPILFETERGFAVAGARLVEVKTLWPARDAYADHSLELAGGRAFTLFDPGRPVAHAFYLAHDTLFAFTGDVTVDIELELGDPGNQPLAIAWEFWDGQVWQRFLAFDAAGGSRDGTGGLTRSGIVKLKVACGQPQKTRVNGIEAYWVRGRLEDALSPDPAQVLPAVDRVRLRSEMNRLLFFRLFQGFFFSSATTMTPAGPARTAGSFSGASDVTHGLLRPDAAFANGLALDVSNTFFPFGQQPQPGSTFYFTSQEIFTKPGATMFFKLDIERTRDPDQKKGETGFQPEVEWEYWNGRQWAALTPEPESSPARRFKHSRFLSTLSLQIPSDMVPVEVNNSTNRWMRARLVSGGYGIQRDVIFPSNSFTIVETLPPAVKEFRLGYTYRSPWEYPEHCLTYNDFQFDVRSDAVRRPGDFFLPFRPVADTAPALYLGFDRPLPNDLISLYFDIQEQDVSPPPLLWEAWDGITWNKLSVTDETAHLSRPGLVSFIAPDIAPRPEAPVTRAQGDQITVSDALAAAVFQPGDRVVVQQDKTSEMAAVREIRGEVIVLETPLTQTYSGGRVRRAALPRFGSPLDWVRARLKDDGAPLRSRLNGIYLNATWAIQIQSIENEVLGSGTGQPGQSVFFAQAPVLPGEAIEVRELEGARAAVELPILREELNRRGLTDDVLRTVSDPRTGRVTEVWVRWQSRSHLFFSGPDDRHYMVERARGRLIFGDGQNGRIPPIGANNLLAARYQAGGGLEGNVPAGTITQLLGSAMIVEGVTNPRAADGGAAGETIEAVKRRGPQRLRHLGRALSVADHEALAREASPGVAIARVLPATAANGRPAPGWVTVVVVPQSLEPRPQPSFELRRQVHDYLLERAAAVIGADQLAVIGPTYLPIGVAAGVVSRELSEAGRVEDRVRAALERFLHPLTGGPEELGWPFGRDVYLSDVAAVLEAVEGVDFVRELELLLKDIPQGEQIAVPPDRIVVAGPLRIEMQGPEG